MRPALPKKPPNRMEDVENEVKPVRPGFNNQV